jgi:hypothetical protein
MLGYVKRNKNAKILIITPLLPNHKVSKLTKRTIKRNDVPYTWITFSSEANTAMNARLGMEAYEEEHELPPYIIKIDNDIELGRHMLDRLLESLENSRDMVAYSYCNFRYKGAVNTSFDAIPFNIEKLLKQNYISSNSLIKVGHLKYIGGFITDERFKRLLDWCLWLQFLHNGYIGIPCTKANFIAHTKKDSVSAGSNQDYLTKRQRVYDTFVVPYVNAINEHKKATGG